MASLNYLEWKGSLFVERESVLTERKQVWTLWGYTLNGTECTLCFLGQGRRKSVAKDCHIQ